MPAMALRPLLRQLATTESGVALAREGGRAFVSASLRPYLVAGLLDGVDDALATAKPAIVVAGDDRQARGLAADLRHWLPPPPPAPAPPPRRPPPEALPPPPPPPPPRAAPDESPPAPPPHLVGLRIAALDALLSSGEPPVVVVSAVALSEKVP